MPNTTTSPNMNLPVPVPGTDPGPDWATNIVADMYAIDSHNHSSGQGVQVTPSGLNINADLPVGSNNVTGVRSVNFSAQAAPIAGASDLGCVYVSGVDLYYNDENGNQVRITQSGSVTGSTGTITGLPSGTASASYSAGTFTFQGSTSTPATMAVGPLVIGAAVASSKTVTLAPSNALAANYALTFPAALPASTSVATVDASGNIALTTGPTLTSPTLTTPVFSGVPTGTVTAGTFTPTVTWSHNSGGTATITNNTFTFYYQRIGNNVTVQGSVAYTITAYSGTTAFYQATATIPIATATLSPAGTSFDTNTNAGQSLTASSNTGVLTLNSVSISSNSSRVMTFSYTYAVN